MRKIIVWCREQIRRYFGFSRRETNGTLVLLMITTIAIVLPPSLVYFRWDSEPPSSALPRPNSEEKQ